MNEATVGVSMPPAMVIVATMTMAASAAGIALVILGRTNMIAMVRPVSPTIVMSRGPCIQPSLSWNMPSCDSVQNNG